MVDEDEYLQFLADGGYMVETIAKLCEPNGIEIGFDEGAKRAAEKTLLALNGSERVTLFEATLISGGRIARVDILKKRGATFELIEVKAKSVDTSTGANPFRGSRGGIVPKMGAVPRRRSVSIFCLTRTLSKGRDHSLPMPRRYIENDKHRSNLLKVRAG